MRTMRPIRETFIRTAGVIAALGVFLCGVSLSRWTSASEANPRLDQDGGASTEGAALYKQRCSDCHDNPQDRVPPLFLIKRRSAEDVVQTLTAGAMRQQASGLNSSQIRALAVYLTGKQPGSGAVIDPAANMCKARSHALDLGGPAWNGWGRDLD